MIKTKHILFIFLPALLVVTATFFIRAIQYEPLFPEQQDSTDQGFAVPIFPEDPVIGERSAPITLIAFEDLGCDACRHQDRILEDVMQRHPGKIKLIWKSFPVTRFPINSENAHLHAFCAHDQNKFEAFKEFAFVNSSNLNQQTLGIIAQEVDLNERKQNSCLESDRPQAYLARNKQLATLLNIGSVPTFFLENKQIPAPQTAEGWIALLNL